ncbi:MAG: carboxymuconolactone decarboxylase family protein [Proteobacteria bacterium]|nr:carboxymuconolactone decarboxylase family protein [Pseudomonadota bacterium]
MTTFPLHSSETAPEGSKPILGAVQKNWGFLPNLIRLLADAPAAVEAYTSLNAIFEKTSFSDTEKQAVLLAVSQVNGCDYCLAAHSTIAGMKKVPADVIKAASTGGTFDDPRLEILVKLTRSIVETRGWPEAALLEAFYAGGYTTANYLELLVGVTMKTLSNYVNHQANTPIDEAFGGGK